jgi:hypothetical protein
MLKPFSAYKKKEKKINKINKLICKINVEHFFCSSQNYLAEYIISHFIFIPGAYFILKHLGFDIKHLARCMILSMLIHTFWETYWGFYIE